MLRRPTGILPRRRMSPDLPPASDRIAARPVETLKQGHWIFGNTLLCENARRRAQPARLKIVVAPAVAATTMSGGARQTIKATKPAAAIAKSAGPLTAL